MRALLAIAALAVVSGCAALPGPAHKQDPWERYNRGMYAFNDAVDRQFLKPVAVTYVEGTPDFLREGVSNFFGNLQDLGTGANNLLQGKFAEGISDLGRFAFNSVVGIGGLWDVATPAGLEKHTEDFGQTLGWWGVPPGPYFVIPLLGPSTLRDAPARWVDPTFYKGRWIDNEAATWSLTGLDIIGTRAQLLKAEKVLDEAALDKYSFTRDAWLQRRRNHVYDGSPPRDPEDE
jgi:phospholipid-binding lipoprotein MlaA